VLAQTLSGAAPPSFEQSELDRAKAQILRFLNYKPRTRAELMQKLVEDKLYDQEVSARPKPLTLNSPSPLNPKSYSYTVTFEPQTL
jgi:hypothetical protein